MIMNTSLKKGFQGCFEKQHVRCLSYVTDITEIGVLRNHTSRCDSSMLCKQLKESQGIDPCFFKANLKLCQSKIMLSAFLSFVELSLLTCTWMVL